MAGFQPSNQNIVPRAGTASAIISGGTAIIIVTGPVNGGYVTNPINAAGQNIVTAENAYVDPVGVPGDTDATGAGTTTILLPGSTYPIPPLGPGQTLKANAATTAHALTVVVW